MSTGNADNFPVVQGESGPAIIDRATGELIPLAEAESGDIAALIDYLTELRSRSYEGTSLLGAELLGRMGRDRSLEAGAFLAEKKDRREWNPDATEAALNELIAAGLVSQPEADEAMPVKSKRVPDGRKLNALLGRLVGEDPVAASPLARARATSSSVKVARRALDTEAIEEAA